jgi:hypothetical protein
MPPISSILGHLQQESAAIALPGMGPPAFQQPTVAQMFEAQAQPEMPGIHQANRGLYTGADGFGGFDLMSSLRKNIQDDPFVSKLVSCF